MGWREQIEALQGAAVRTFTEPVTYSPAAGGSLELTGIFRQSHIGVDPGMSIEVSSENPVLELRASDLPAGPNRADRVVIRSVRYRVADHIEDGEGMLSLELIEAPVS
jgi:hypothetical protein